MRKKRQYDDDDGRTIVNMNVEGMPWYVPKQSENSSHEPIQLSRKERLGMFLGIFKAVVLVMLAFAGVYFLVIFLMTKLW